MTCNKLKRILFVLFISGGSFTLSGQNLVPNHSFETIQNCPISLQGICENIASPWVCPTLGTSDVFNSCSTLPSGVNVPQTFFGYQNPVTGEGYAGFICKWTFHLREYVKVMLNEPLIADEWYEVSFYVSLANTTCGVPHIGAFITTEDLYQPIFSTLLVQPQIESEQGFLNDTLNWELISGCFQAEGGEQHIIIGNFRDEAETPLDPDCVGDKSYYFIDDVSLMATDPPEEIVFDLGGPEYSCFSYEIDPQHPGPYFIWENGSNNPTLTVTESGTYSLTITDGCSIGIDSIEVVIDGNQPPVEIGEDEVVICSGDTYTVNLDPDLEIYEWNDGSNDPTYTISTPGVYSVTLDDGCSTSTDAINVIVIDPPPPVNLGDDLLLCNGVEQTWAFDPGIGQFTWQDGSTSSTYTASTSGIYAVTITNMCGMESDDILITSLDQPQVDFGIDEELLCNGETYPITLDPDAGEFIWQDGSTDPDYTITGSGIYSVTVSNACGSDSDQIDISTLNNPVVNLGSDIVLCTGDSILLSSPGTDGDYEWQDNSTASELLVTTSGMYSLSVFNECGQDMDEINVDFIPLVSAPDLGPDVSLCPGEQVVLHANITDVNYLWQDLSTSDTLVVNAAGTYVLQVSNSCSQNSDTIIVSINDNPPLVDLPASVNLCQGESITLDATIGGVSYLWSDNSQNQLLLASTPGTYSVTVSNACGMDADTTIILDGGPAPTVALGNDLQLCPGDTLLLSPVFSNVDTWLWNDGSVMSQYNVTAEGQITVAVQNSCGTSYDTLQASLLPATPPLDLGADTSLCPGESFVLTINTPGVSILWPDASTGPDFTVNGSGPVIATISNSCGQSYDTIHVDALLDIPALNLGLDQSLCPGELIVFNPGITDVNYLWQDGSANNTFQTTQEGTIILSISNNCGVATDTVEIIESTQGPVVDLGPDVQDCEGETVTILSGISGVDYLWQDGSNNPDFFTTQSGEFILHVSNNCGTDADTVLVDISGVPPAPAIGPDTTLCEGVTLNLISNADQETTIEWQDGSSSPSFTVSTAGTYILSESNRCGDAADTIVVSYLDAPDPFSLGPDTTLCPGEFLTLTTPTTAFEILWQDGSNQNSILADQAQTYSLAISNICGQVFDEITLSFDTRIPTLHLDASIPWCEGDVIDLDATQPFLAEYSWSTGEIIPSIQISTPGIYSIDVNTLCQSASQTVEVFEDTDCVEVVIETHYEIYIPNVFSPNGDGINDVFAMSFGADLHPTSIVGSIFDRWGNLVYHSDALTFQWDGYFGEESVMPGVYAYTIKVKYIEQGIERVEELVGDVTLVR